MFDCGLSDINICLKVYPLIVQSEQDLYRFISGSALIPYMEKLLPEEQELFVSAFLEKIKLRLQPFPAIYAFKRILLYGRA
jgi:trans-aconitate 2-methyltransferase